MAKRDRDEKRAGRSWPRLAGTALLVVLGLYLLVRGIAEFWVIDYSDPASYAADWGGPSLAGVLAVHSGPALLVIVGALWWSRRRRRHAPESSSVMSPVRGDPSARA
jgi:hypothetical protein